MAEPSQMSSPADIQHYLRPGLLQLKSLPPLSLYVHLPWCLKKCPYCDFNSHAAKGELETAYLATHRFSLEDAPRGYDMFKHKTDGCVRAVFAP